MPAQHLEDTAHASLGKCGQAPQPGKRRHEPGQDKQAVQPAGLKLAS